MMKNHDWIKEIVKNMPFDIYVKLCRDEEVTYKGRVINQYDRDLILEYMQKGKVKDK